MEITKISMRGVKISVKFTTIPFMRCQRYFRLEPSCFQWFIFRRELQNSRAHENRLFQLLYSSTLGPYLIKYVPKCGTKRPFGPCKAAQNHRFFWAREFCNSLSWFKKTGFRLPGLANTKKMGLFLGYHLVGLRIPLAHDACIRELFFQTADLFNREACGLCNLLDGKLLLEKC